MPTYGKPCSPQNITSQSQAYKYIFLLFASTANHRRKALFNAAKQMLEHFYNISHMFQSRKTTSYDKTDHNNTVINQKHCFSGLTGSLKQI